MIYDAIYSLLILIEKFAFFNKQLEGFIIFLKASALTSEKASMRSKLLANQRITLALTTAQKMKFSIKDFSSKCDQIHNFLWIWSHSLE